MAPDEEWPPQIAKTLPRVLECWYEPIKFERWILAPHGHGLQWETVLHVGLDDVEAVWAAISAAVVLAPVSAVIDTGYGINCRVDVEITIGERTAPVRTAWHYADAESNPRLVSAYPRL